MTKITRIEENPVIFYLLLGAIVFAAVLYVYSVNSAVRNAVARGESQSAIAELQTKVSELEYKYLAIESRMTIELAEHLGLYEPSEKVFISRNQRYHGLSMYNRE